MMPTSEDRWRWVYAGLRLLRDDGLRILRLVRFAAALGFSVDPDTWAAAQAHAALLGDVAWERKREELSRMLVGERVYEALVMLHEVKQTGIVVA